MPNLGRKNGNKFHVIKDYNLQEKKGSCSICGKVSINHRFYKGKLKLRCNLITNLTRKKYKHFSKYGTTLPETRPDICEICDKRCITFYDHDHKTMKFRGWICRQCNSMLGLAYDKTEILDSASKYLERNR